MPSARVTYWYLQSFWRKYKKIVLGSIGIGVLLVLVFPTLIRFIPSRRTVTYIGRVGQYSFVDLPMDIQTKISVGLTGLNAQGEAVPVLAQRWTTEEDGKAFRFLLKDNLHWQDGKPFTAADVNYDFTDVQTVPQDNSILFRLQEPYAPFPTVVSQPLFRQEQVKRFHFIVENRVIGLGEYSVENLKYQSNAVKELTIANDKERLVYRFYPTEQDALIAFRAGQVDKIEDLSSLNGFTKPELDQLNTKQSVNLNQVVGVFFNTSAEGLSKDVRQALNYATHKPEANDAKLRALGPIPPTSWAYNSTDEVNPFSYDLAKAIEIYKDTVPHDALSINLDSVGSLLPDAQQIANDWQNMGKAAEDDCKDRTLKGKLTQEEKGLDCARFRINVTVRVVQDIQDFQAILIAREAPADPDQYSWWHSNQPNNISHYENPRVDKLLEDARKEPDEAKRKVQYFDFQRYLVEDVPAMFMYHLPEFTVQRENKF